MGTGEVGTIEAALADAVRGVATLTRLLERAETPAIWEILRLGIDGCGDFVGHLAPSVRVRVSSLRPPLCEGAYRGTKGYSCSAFGLWSGVCVAFVFLHPTNGPWGELTPYLTHECE